MKPRVCAVIPARAGSRGLPGKNRKVLNGKPLMAHSIGHAHSARCIDRVFVSTDSAELARIAFEYEAEVPCLRPRELAGDASPVVDAVEHLLSELADYAPDYVVLLQPTSPLRTAVDIDQAFAAMHSKAQPATVSVCEAQNHPYLCRAVDAEGVMKPYINSPLNGARRQELPPAYVLNGALYIIRTEVLLQGRNWCPAGSGAYIMPTERSVDIDTEMDFAWAEWLLKNQTEIKAA